jgi:hypothetical protein
MFMNCIQHTQMSFRNQIVKRMNTILIASPQNGIKRRSWLEEKQVGIFLDRRRLYPRGPRTRHGGQGRPNITFFTSKFSDSEDEEQEEEEEEQDVSKKPPFSRAVLEVDAMSDAMNKHCRCTECYGPRTVSLKTVCPASKIIQTCNDPTCQYVHNGDADRVITEGPDKRERSTDYSSNVLYVLAFITCSDGGAEAARLLGLLGLANDKPTKTCTLKIIEDMIGPSIRKLTQEILAENLVAAGKATMDSSPERCDGNTCEQWKQKIQGNTTVAICIKNIPSSFFAMP